MKAYFAGDKQVARRTRAAYASSPGSFVHYLHYDVHRYHVGVVAPKERGAQRFVQEPVMVEPPGRSALERRLASRCLHD